MNIGIIGRARVGKDTAGKWLVDNRGYRRVAFADALKEAALKADPIVDVTEHGRIDDLFMVVDDFGWEEAKDRYHEVRRFLQELGAAVRAIDEDFWLRAAMKKVVEANDAGVPCVITDVRYPNEAASLKRAGFRLVFMERPGVPRMGHASENSLTPADADDYIHNAGDVDELHRMVESLWEDVYRVESARSVHVH